MRWGKVPRWMYFALIFLVFVFLCLFIWHNSDKKARQRVGIGPFSSVEKTEHQLIPGVSDENVTATGNPYVETLVEITSVPTNTAQPTKESVNTLNPESSYSVSTVTVTSLPPIPTTGVTEPSPTSIPQPTATVEPSSTSVPTWTPQPTATMEPSSTSVLTWTQLPTATYVAEATEVTVPDQVTGESPGMQIVDSKVEIPEDPHDCTTDSMSVIRGQFLYSDDINISIMPEEEVNNPYIVSGGDIETVWLIPTYDAEGSLVWTTEASVKCANWRVMLNGKEATSFFNVSGHEEDVYIFHVTLQKPAN